MMIRRLPAFLIACIAGLCQAQTNSESVIEQNPVWKQFRQTYPFHAQVVALTRPGSEGRRTLILSEPPPHVTVDGLRRLLGPAALGFHVMKQPMGVDGWVKDVVIDLDALTPSQVNETISAVHWYAFGTTYKASALMLPASTVNTRPQVDLSFTMSDLEDHVLSSGELFANPSQGTPSTVAALLRSRKTGLFYSTRPGAVVWIVARGADLSRDGKTIRRFALDTDLILGAAANETHVAIVARERVIPVEWLPPLRAETIVLLASAEGTQLEQSYERNYIYAGEIEKDLDWAPIYLSAELIDTEYGSLLNITDQLLKSWSESGKVRYAQFRYPQPAIPFPFEGGLYKNAHAREVTYNWNTKGFGYVVKGATLETFAVNRTGALPVSYIAGQNSLLHQKEEQGYRFFAHTNDPNLARVVQYGALYQIFRRYKLSAPRPRAISDDAPDPEVVAGLQLKLTDALRMDLSAKEERLVRAYPADARDIHQQFADFRRFQEELRAVQQEPSGLKQLADCMVAGRFTYDCTAAIPRGSHIPAALDASSNEYFRHIMLTESDRTRVMRARLARNKARDNGWIKTPSIVMSSNPGMEGGHNIGARVYEFRTSPTLKAGEVRIGEENGHSIINLSEADRGKSSSLVPWLHRVMEQGTGASRTDIEAELARTVTTRHPRDVALGLPSGGLNGPRVFETRNTALPQTSAGYTRQGAASDRALAIDIAKMERLGPSIVVSRESANSYSVVTPVRMAEASMSPVVERSAAEARAHDLESVTELLADSYSQGNFGVHLKGVTPDEALAFRKMAEFRIEAQTGKKVEISAFAENDGRFTAKTYETLSDSHYDLAHPKISAPEITRVEEGSIRGTRVDYQLEFKSVTPARPSLVMRIRMFFADNVLAPTRQALDAALGKALLRIQAMRGRAVPVNNRLAMLTIKAELRKVCPADADMRIELSDLYLVMLDSPARHEAGLPQAG